MDDCTDIHCAVDRECVVVVVVVVYKIDLKHDFDWILLASSLLLLLKRNQQIY